MRSRQIMLILCIPPLATVAACEDRNQNAERRPSDVEAVELTLLDARKSLASATLKELKSSEPINDATLLSAKLRLSDARVRAFDASGPSIEKVATAFSGRYICVPGTCVCDGDADCNDLFSGVCRDPSTGGKCWVTADGRTVCSCHPPATR